MYVLTELYSPKSSWLALPASEKSNYVAAIRQAVAQMNTVGIQCLAIGRMDASSHAGDVVSPHRYLGVWTAKDKTTLSPLLEGLRGAGWYDYFEQINGLTANQGLEQHLQDLEKLN